MSKAKKEVKEKTKNKTTEKVLHQEEIQLMASTITPVTAVPGANTIEVENLGGGSAFVSGTHKMTHEDLLSIGEVKRFNSELLFLYGGSRPKLRITHYK